MSLIAKLVICESIFAPSPYAGDPIPVETRLDRDLILPAPMAPEAAKRIATRMLDNPRTNHVLAYSVDGIETKWIRETPEIPAEQPKKRGRKPSEAKGVEVKPHVSKAAVEALAPEAVRAKRASKPKAEKSDEPEVYTVRVYGTRKRTSGERVSEVYDVKIEGSIKRARSEAIKLLLENNAPGALWWERAELHTGGALVANMTRSDALLLVKAPPMPRIPTAADRVRPVCHKPMQPYGGPRTLFFEGRAHQDRACFSRG